MFPNQDKGGGKPSDKGGKPKPKQGPGAQHDLHNPPKGGPPGMQQGGPPQGMMPGGPPSLPQVGPKPGQGMNPQEAMMFGLGDLSHLAPPPPAPMAPMGAGGLPVGANLPSSDPMMDPNMNGSGLFQSLNMQLDPMGGGGPLSETMEPPLDLNSLLAILALQKGGLPDPNAMPGMGPQNMNALNPSGVMNDPVHPGEARNLQEFNVIQ
jgi:hypothetical protein